jgi:hypothetical protein
MCYNFLKKVYITPLNYHSIVNVPPPRMSLLKLSKNDNNKEKWVLPDAVAATQQPGGPRGHPNFSLGWPYSHPLGRGGSHAYPST